LKHAVLVSLVTIKSDKDPSPRLHLLVRKHTAERHQQHRAHDVTASSPSSPALVEIIAGVVAAMLLSYNAVSKVAAQTQTRVSPEAAVAGLMPGACMHVGTSGKGDVT
jgi:hypothetical protein